MIRKGKFRNGRQEMLMKEKDREGRCDELKLRKDERKIELEGNERNKGSDGGTEQSICNTTEDKGLV